ncbi:MAG TPA: hypothetical protein VFE29_00680 [Terriglobia bacterium]|nr:hypothetical protein [Terriglobia bacterium]
MKLRDLMLVGLALCALTLSFNAVEYPVFVEILRRSSWLVFLMSAIVIWISYAAIARTQAKTEEDALVLRDGRFWGIAVSCAWTLVTIVPMGAGAPLWFFALFSGLLLPWVAGAATAIKTGHVRAGMRVGFWSSAIGGLAGFLVATVSGLLVDTFPALSVLGVPSLNSLQLAIAFMFFLGAVPGTVGGLIGGWAGLALYRTGQPT